jgi:hypothetical protein
VNWRLLQWSKGVGYVAGGGLGLVFALGGPHWAAIGFAVASAAGLANVLWPAPQKHLTPDAVAVDHQGNVTGENVTTTTTAPIIAPVIKAAP